MSKEEILLEIEKLKNMIEGVTDEPTDDIYLLSIEEYKKYKDKIPHINIMWWLRSPGPVSKLATYVYWGSISDNRGYDIYRQNGAVRPALKYTNLKSRISQSSIRNNRFIFNDFPFVIIDEEKEIAIAEMPITFDKFDDYSNDYNNSYIRKWLLKWFAKVN